MFGDQDRLDHRSSREGPGGISDTQAPARSAPPPDLARLRRAYRILVCGGLLTLAAVAFAGRAWLCDDAYITFRHVQQLLDGNGLTYNPGGRVEGFTHPLWAILLVLCALGGLRIPAAAVTMGLVAAVLLVALLLYEEVRPPASPSGGPGAASPRSLPVPVSVVLLLSCSGSLDFATGGLEAALSSLLLALAAVSIARRSVLALPIRHGLPLGLAYLCHPDLALFGVPVVLLAFLQWRRTPAPEPRRGARRAFGLLVAGLALPGVVYHAFRLAYYGELLPTPFFAKGGGAAFWSQGFVYVRHFLTHAPVTWFGLAALAWAIGGDLRRRPRRWGRLAMAGALLLHVGWVARVGGDFMAFRLLVPDLAVLAALVTRSLSAPWPGARAPAPAQLAMGLLLMGVAVYRAAYAPLPPAIDGWIADERQHYAGPPAPMRAAWLDDPTSHPWWIRGERLRRFQRCIGDTPLFVVVPNIGITGYAAGTRVTILDQVGLVDREVARNWGVMPAGVRGRPGHEDKLTLEICVARGVQIWQTPFHKYNRVMGTRLGPIITLDPSFLRFFPGKVAALQALRREVAAGATEDDRQLRQFLRRLEARHAVRIPELPLPRDPSRGGCGRILLAP